MDCGNLQKIIIPDNVKEIGHTAFSRCYNLKTVVMENGVEKIGNSAFEHCQELSSITFSKKLKTIESDAFLFCEKLKNIELYNGIEEIQNSAFRQCSNLKTIVLPKSINKLGEIFGMYCNATVFVSSNSYAETYVKNNSLDLKYRYIGDENNTIVFSSTNKTLKLNQTIKLVPTIKTANEAPDKRVTWSTSNEKIVSITDNGTIKAINYGTSIITAELTNGKTATCKVTVPYTVKYNLNGGTNNKSNPTSYYGKKITLQNPTRKGYVFAGWYSDSKYKTKITSFSSGNKTLYAKWNKVTVAKAKTPTLTNIETRKLKVSYTAISGVKGYQIQYATNSKFTGSKTKTTTARSSTLTSLTKGKRYYVRVRGYKLDSTGNKVYGSWSSVKSIVFPKGHTHNYNIPITKTVHHDAVTHQENKVVKAAYEEPIYEERYVCTKCGFNTKDGGKMTDHILEVCKRGYTVKDVQVGTKHHDAITKTVTVVDKAAYDETVTIGYKCSCGAKK